MPSLTAGLTLDSLTLEEERLASIRRAIYHSSGPGYFVIRGFLNQQQAAHLRTIWLEPETPLAFAEFQGKKYFYAGCPNYVARWPDRNFMYFNFLWNPMIDDITMATAFVIQMLRCRVTGTPVFRDVFPISGNSVCCRAILNSNADVHIDLHRDMYDEENALDKKRFSLSQVQVTLNLSRYGEDYGGDGVLFETNQGNLINLGRDAALDPGDLVIWRTNNRHGVKGIVTRSDQLGFLRMIYTPEIIYPSAPASETDAAVVHSSTSRNLLSGLPPVLRSAARALWRRVR